MNYDIGKFLYDNLLDYAFPSLEYSSDCLSIQENGLVLQNKEQTSIVLLNNDAFKKRLTVNDYSEVRILSTFETKDYLYIGSLVAPFLARLSKKRSNLLL